LYIIGKTTKHLFKDTYLKFILFLPIFYTIKYFGHYIGALRKLFLKKNTRI